MGTMYIKKGSPIIIEVDGYMSQRYFGYSLRDAIRNYRKRNGLERLHFKKVYCSASAFGYL